MEQGIKMKIQTKPLLLLAIALLADVLAFPLPAFSQSCALCYTQAASSGARMIAGVEKRNTDPGHSAHARIHRNDFYGSSETQSV